MAQARTYGSRMTTTRTNPSPLDPRRPAAHVPRSFSQPRANEGLKDSQRHADRGRTAARHDALVVAWLRALGRT
jgi:hypothetical protein